MLIHDITPVMQVEKKLRRFDNFVFGRFLGPIPERSAKWGAAILGVYLPLYFLALRPVFGIFLNLGFLTEIFVFVGAGATLAFVGGRVATTRMAHGKEVSALFSSWVSFRFNSRRFVDFRPWRGGGVSRAEFEFSTNP